MNEKEIQVFAPATVANVACGFDIFGFALEQPGDQLTLQLNDSNRVTLKEISGDSGALPKDPSKNTATVALCSLLAHLQIKQGVEVTLQKKMPLKSGLGSSAASAAGSLYALNTLLGNPLSSDELIPFAMEAERVACGSAHADNVAPALLGGFVLIRSYAPLDVVKIPLGLELHCTILHPRIEVDTAYARSILSPQISLKQHVIQSGNSAGLVAGLIEGDAALIKRCLIDVIVEPVRARLIPGFDQMKAAALEAGALGCSLSGSGPSLFALSLSSHHAEKIGESMAAACRRQNLESDLYLSKINNQGPRTWH
jgi:homoserine kinase